ncbi:MAG: DUF1579 family protein [Planctomycetota bacterium]
MTDKPQTMRTALAFFTGVASVLLLGATLRTDIVPLRAQDPGAQDPQAMKEMMAKAAKFTQPGPLHKELEKFVGTWTTGSAFVMGGNKTPASPGTMTFRWLMEGRWLACEWKGTLMGRPYESFWLLGYDNFKKSFVITTVQNMDTAMLRSEGDLTQDGKTLITWGTLDEYLTGEHDKIVKNVFRFVDADHITIEVHDMHIGESNTQVLDIALTRK